MSNTIYSPQVQGNVQAEVLCHSMLKQHSISKSRIGEFDVNDLLSNSHAVQAYSMPEVKNTQSSNDNFQYSVAQDGYPPWDWQSGGSYEAMSNQFEFGSVACHTQIIEPRQTSLELGRKNNPSAIALGGTQAYQQSRTIYDLHCHFAFSVDSTVASSSAKVSDTSSHTFSLPTVSATPDGPVTKHTSVFVEEPMPCPLAVGRSSSRDTQDQFLIMSKLSGMPYKEIKAQGQFREAESTLRGRFRSLTKSKAQRVRKPQWQERDIQLLRQAVSQMAKKGKRGKATDELSATPGHSECDQISWKKVAEYIALYGSYHFGNATCRKKWDEINGISSK